jgi:hypothetical protein
MKTFIDEKVRKIAIDSVKHQQLLVWVDENYPKIEALLIEMGFNLKPMSKDPSQQIILYINTIDKKAFVANAIGLYCGAQFGAKALNYETLLTLINLK